MALDEGFHPLGSLLEAQGGGAQTVPVVPVSTKVTWSVQLPATSALLQKEQSALALQVRRQRLWSPRFTHRLSAGQSALLLQSVLLQ